MTEEKQLFRSNSDRWVAGVLAGVAQYFGWDVNVVRIAYLALTVFTAFSGVPIYILLWILIPRKRTTFHDHRR